MSDKPISDLRRRMIADMSIRTFSDKTQHDYIRHVEAFAMFLGRSPDTATGDDIRRFQLAQVEHARGRSEDRRGVQYDGSAHASPWRHQGLAGLPRCSLGDQERGPAW